MTARIKKMVENWKKNHWASSHINNDDSDFFKAIRMNSFRVSTTSNTGSDIIYYKRSKMAPWSGGVIPLKRYNEIIRKRKNN